MYDPLFIRKHRLLKSVTNKLNCSTLFIIFLKLFYHSFERERADLKQAIFSMKRFNIELIYKQLVLYLMGMLLYLPTLKCNTYHISTSI